MTRGERKQMERQAEAALRQCLGDNFREVDFCYWRGSKSMLVVYEDYKSESEAKREVMEAVGPEWKVVVKREFSDMTVMLTMLKLYKENRIAVVDVEEGELRPYEVRAYVNRLMGMY